MFFKWLRKISIEFKIYFFIFFIGLLTFSIYSIWDFSLLLGWIFSFISLSISFFIKIYLLKIWLEKKTNKQISKKKKVVFLLFLFLSVVTLLLQSGILLSIIFFNKNFHDYKFGIKTILWPINIFSYLVGISLIVPTIIISLFFKNRKEA